jgi:hypothetical protein
VGAESAHHIRPGKKIKATTREPNGAAFMLRCSELGLVADDVLASYTMGMVYDMLTEKNNDYEKYPLQATQEEFDKF